MTKEELKLVLEALENAVRYHGIMLMSDPPQDAWKYHKVEDKADKAITAIKEALAQPQRTWVGLTNNDLQPIAEEYRILFGSWVHDFARAIEAKLKEKNT